MTSLPDSPNLAGGEGRTPPPALKWLTAPLLIELLGNGLTLLSIPFLQEDLTEQFRQAIDSMGVTGIELTPDVLQTLTWSLFLMVMLMTVAVYFTLEGVKRGRSWAWVATLLIAVFSLLTPPFGTLLGLALLYGAFQKPVRAYFGR